MFYRAFLYRGTAHRGRTEGYCCSTATDNAAHSLVEFYSRSLDIPISGHSDLTHGKY